MFEVIYPGCPRGHLGRHTPHLLGAGRQLRLQPDHQSRLRFPTPLCRRRVSLRGEQTHTVTA